jgi:hypothetical protein
VFDLLCTKIGLYRRFQSTGEGGKGQSVGKGLGLRCSSKEHLKRFEKEVRSSKGHLWYAQRRKGRQGWENKKQEMENFSLTMTSWRVVMKFSSRTHPELRELDHSRVDHWLLVRNCAPH